MWSYNVGDTKNMSSTAAPVGAVIPKFHVMTGDEKKIILASSLGTVFERYDFYLYGSLAVIIGAKFFGQFPETTRKSSPFLRSPPDSWCVCSAPWCSAASAIWSGANIPS